MAVLYLDSSALVKLYAAEQHSEWTLELVRGRGFHSDLDRGADAAGDEERLERIFDARTRSAVAVSALAWVETRSALAAKERVRALTRAQRLQAEEVLALDFRESFLVRPVSGTVLAAAGDVAAPLELRAYDAVQLATALVLRSELSALAEAQREDEPDEVLMLSYDDDLHDAAVEEGIAHSRPWRAGGRAFRVP